MKRSAQGNVKRWQAHFDLMMGRLLATRVRCNEYNWITGQMRVSPKAPTGKTKEEAEQYLAAGTRHQYHVRSQGCAAGKRGQTRQ
ncbi:MAG: hypothetical protein U1D30_02380 [Planctomycetota bacterium]